MDGDLCRIGLWKRVTVVIIEGVGDGSKKKKKK